MRLLAAALCAMAMGEEGDGSMNHGDYGSQNTGAGSHIATTMAMTASTARGRR